MRRVLEKNGPLVVATVVSVAGAGLMTAGWVRSDLFLVLLVVCAACALFALRGWSTFFRTPAGKMEWAALFDHDIFAAMRARKMLVGALLILFAAAMTPAIFSVRLAWQAALLAALACGLVLIAFAQRAGVPERPESFRRVPSGIVIVYSTGEVRVPWRLVSALREVPTGAFRSLVGLQIGSVEALVEILRSAVGDRTSVDAWTKVTLLNEREFGAPFVLLPKDRAEFDALFEDARSSVEK